MTGKRNTKLWRARKKAIGKAPVWLKTVAIAKDHGRPRIQGTFGAASECVSVLRPLEGVPALWVSPCDQSENA